MRWILIALIVAGCSSTKVTDDNLAALGAGTKVTLDSVTFHYDQWASAEADDIERARKYNASWTKALRKGFDRRAERDGIAGEGERVSIDVVDLEPGSQAGRYWGLGSGAGFVVAHVRVGSRGSFSVRGDLKGGWFGGMFEGIMSALGDTIARQIKKKIG